MNSELLQDIDEIKSYQKTQITLAHIRTIASLLALAAVVAALVFFAPRALDMIDHINTTLSSVDSMVAEADDTFSSLKDTLRSANGLTADSTDELAEAIEKINSIDFDTLNQSISSLQEVVSGLSRLTGFFGR